MLPFVFIFGILHLVTYKRNVMTSIEKRTELFENAPVKSAVLKQIIPSIAGQMIALIYNLADTYFVGMLNDPKETAAVTVVMPVFVMLTAISNLFGVGGASLVAQSLGKKDNDRAKRISSVAFYCGICSSVLFSLIVGLLLTPILKLCGADSSTFDIAVGYAKWVVIIGGPATIMNMLLANIVRAEGNATVASVGVAFGGVMNIILDPFFVLPKFFGYGAVGAGIATAASNLLAALFFVCYIIIKRNSSVVSINPSYIKNSVYDIPKILSIGFPSAIQFTLTVVAAAVITKFVSPYGPEAVAAFGIVKKLDQLPLYFSIGVANGLLPLLAYNYSAGKLKRERDSFIFGTAISLSFSLLCLVIYEIFAPTLAGLFIDEEQTREYAAVFLRIMVTAMPMMSVCYPMIIRMQSTGRVKEALICSVIRKGVLDIPLLFALDSLIGLYGCVMVQPIVDAVSLVVAICFVKREKIEEV